MSTDKQADVFDGQGISQALAELLAKEWPMPDRLDFRAVLASDLILLFDAVQSVGLVEHSGDWDWRVTVTMKDGTVYGTDYPTDEEPNRRSVWGDTIALSLADEEAMMTLEQIRNNTWWKPPEDLLLGIEEFEDPTPDEDPILPHDYVAKYVWVRLADVASITYEEL